MGSEVMGEKIFVVPLKAKIISVTEFLLFNLSSLVTSGFIISHIQVVKVSHVLIFILITCIHS